MAQSALYKKSGHYADLSIALKRSKRKKKLYLQTIYQQKLIFVQATIMAKYIKLLQLFEMHTQVTSSVTSLKVFEFLD
jgi:hypothetical protein